MNDIDWSKAPEGADAGYLGTSHAYDAWYRRDDNGEVYQICPAAGFNVWVNMGGRKDFPVGAVLRPVEWKGPEDGLPPIGTAVELDFHGNVEFLPDSLKGWIDGDKIICIAHYALQGGDRVSPIFFNKRLFTFSALREDCYVPIRTPEQIEAEERERRIAELASVIKVSGWNSPEILAAYLDSHDYRKQVQP